MKLIPATEDDYASAFDIYVEVFRSHIDSIWGWDDDWQSNNFRSEWNRFEVKIIHHENAFVGYLQTETTPEQIYIVALAISQPWQSQGIGSKVLRLLLNSARENPIPVRLNVFRTNQGVIKFYRRLGFEVESKTESGVQLQWKP